MRLLPTILVLFVAGAAGYLWGKRETEAPPPTSETIVRNTPSVVVALRDLARLEGTVFHIERVIDLKEKQSRFYGLVEAEDAILLVASGDVVAGVDLAKLREADISADPETGAARVVLPPAEILSRRVDNDRTYVHTRQTDVLARRAEELETDARREAERTLGEAAIAAGILPRAEESVGRTVEALLRSLGYTQVEVTFRGPPGEGE